MELTPTMTLLKSLLITVQKTIRKLERLLNHLPIMYVSIFRLVFHEAPAATPTSVSPVPPAPPSPPSGGGCRRPAGWEGEGGQRGGRYSCQGNLRNETKKEKCIKMLFPSRSASGIDEIGRDSDYGGGGGGAEGGGNGSGGRRKGRFNFPNVRKPR